MRVFRLFISSPGDAAVERRRAENVVSRLNGEFAGLARLQAIRWETEFYRAHSTFQAQIPPAADCDVVVGILRWRLGTELPPEFPEHLADGEAYPSGTAYEILSAIDKRRHGAELPDVFVFRFVGSAPQLVLDDPNRAAIERDWEALRGFIQRWFETPEGHFKAAFNPYASEDALEAALETLLRRWLAEKVAGGRVVAWPATKGSPFRGLSVFGAKHAPVFFGRLADVRRAVDLWRDAAAGGIRFLLIVGASGAGKSSLARAGVAPRLTTPGVVAEVDVWRVAVLRPGDSAAGPFAALAAALMQGDADLPPEEEGRGPALPEIAEGDSKTPADLAAVLAHAGPAAARPVLNALARVAERAREAGRFGREVRCELVLVVDQLDELFAPSVTEETRGGFADLLAALVASGRVWLVATLRADLYAGMLTVPALKRLKDAGASLDLAPPGAAELAEIVRAPAAAAGLVYEKDPTTGESLDARLLREAERPDMLPLVELALSRLYEARVTVGDETLLPVEAYARLGGLKGIIEEAGETALASVGEPERAGLAPLIRQLAEVAHGPGATAGTLTARAAPLGTAAPDAAGRRLVEALVAARLLTLSGAGEAVQVRLAHQRMLTDWTRAATIVAANTDFYRIRDEVEAARGRWAAGGRRGELLLARGLPLAEAESIVGSHGSELPPETRAFVASSRRRASRAQMIVYGVAALFAILAVGAGVAAKVALDQRNLAEASRSEAEAQKAAADRNFAAAKTTVDGLIFNIAQGLRDVAGMRIETIRSILETVQRTVDELIAATPDDPQLLRSQAAMFNNFAFTYLAAGDLKDARDAADHSLAILRRLAANDRSAGAQRDLAVGLDRLGDLKLQGGDADGALAAYAEGLAIDRKLAEQSPSEDQPQRDLALGVGKVGTVKLRAGDQAGALAAMQEAVDITRKLVARTPDNPQVQRDLAAALTNIGVARVQGGDEAGALAAFQECIDIARKLVARTPGNAQALRDLAIALDNGGAARLETGDDAGAFAAFQESLGIARDLARQDPGSAQARSDVATILGKLGDAKLRIGDQPGALAVYAESLDIIRALAAQDPDNVEKRGNLITALNDLGDAKLEGGDGAGALALYQESLAIARQLDARAGAGVQAQRTLAVALNKVGDAKLQAGDKAGALAAYRESLDIVRRLVAADPGNAQQQRDLSIGLNKLGDGALQDGDVAGALAAFQESLDIVRKLAARQPDSTQPQRDVSISLSKLGDAKQRAGDEPGALAAYQESLDVRRRLAERSPGDAQAAHDLTLAIDRIAAAKASRGDTAGVIAAYRESLDIRRKLAAQAPANVQMQIEIVATLSSLAVAGDDPQTRLTEALAILRQLDAAGRLPPDRKAWIQIVEQALATMKGDNK